MEVGSGGGVDALEYEANPLRGHGRTVTALRLRDDRYEVAVTGLRFRVTVTGLRGYDYGAAGLPDSASRPGQPAAARRRSVHGPGGRNGARHRLVDPSQNTGPGPSQETGPDRPRKTVLDPIQWTGPDLSQKNGLVRSGRPN